MKAFALVLPLILSAAVARGSDWPQLQGDALRSGNVAGAAVKMPLGLAGAVPLTDGIYAAPVVADGKVFAIDGSGVVSVCPCPRSSQLMQRQSSRSAAICGSNIARLMK